MRRIATLASVLLGLALVASLLAACGGDGKQATPRGPLPTRDPDLPPLPDFEFSLTVNCPDGFLVRVPFRAGEILPAFCFKSEEDAFAFYIDANKAPSRMPRVVETPELPHKEIHHEDIKKEIDESLKEGTSDDVRRRAFDEYSRAIPTHIDGSGIQRLVERVRTYDGVRVR